MERNKKRLYWYMVGAEGIEPTTVGLKARQLAGLPTELRTHLCQKQENSTCFGHIRQQRARAEYAILREN